jgi:hypothetical protein
MANSRERAVTQALRLLGRERFVSFVRAIRQGADCLAVQLVNEELDDGGGVDGLFFTGDEFGYHLAVTRVATLEFRIEFGCMAGHLAGDGGEWDVLFDAEGSVSRITGGASWIS